MSVFFQISPTPLGGNHTTLNKLHNAPKVAGTHCFITASNLSCSRLTPLNFTKDGVAGGPSRIRTDDLLITNQLLWPSELSGHIVIFFTMAHHTRTYNLLVQSQGQFLGLVWRKRQDSNLHRVAPERFSRPRQYQLCLLFHRRAVFVMRIPLPRVNCFLPQSGPAIHIG